MGMYNPLDRNPRLTLCTDILLACNFLIGITGADGDEIMGFDIGMDRFPAGSADWGTGPSEYFYPSPEDIMLAEDFDWEEFSGPDDYDGLEMYRDDEKRYPMDKYRRMAINAGMEDYDPRDELLSGWDYGRDDYAPIVAMNTSHDDEFVTGIDADSIAVEIYDDQLPAHGSSTMQAVSVCTIPHPKYLRNRRRRRHSGTPAWLKHRRVAQLEKERNRDMVPEVDPPTVEITSWPLGFTYVLLFFSYERMHS
jgi:hypothetical protein